MFENARNSKEIKCLETMYLSSIQSILEYQVKVMNYLSLFRKTISQTPPKPPIYYTTGARKFSSYHTRIQNNFSGKNNSLYSNHISSLLYVIVESQIKKFLYLFALSQICQGKGTIINVLHQNNFPSDITSILFGSDLLFFKSKLSIFWCCSDVC